MEGLNVRVNIYARTQGADDAVGGSVRSENLRYGNVQARISHRPMPALLSQQGMEGPEQHKIIIYPDVYPAIEKEDIVVPQSGRWTGHRFRVRENPQGSSVLPGLDRAHVQLVTDRLRYADDNVSEPLLTGVD
jgi:hypothetical protein